jgi:hypothetical protein
VGALVVGVEDEMTSHVIRRPYGKTERCGLCQVRVLVETHDEIVARIWAEERQKMATMGREAAWDADGREVTA